MTRKRTLSPDKDGDADAVQPEQRMRLSRSLLLKYYSAVTTMYDVLVSSGHESADLVKQGDDDGYTTLVRHSLVAAFDRDTLCDPKGLRAEQGSFDDISMAEVVEQAQMRIFAHHRKSNPAKAARHDKQARSWNSKLPQNMLALGYRPSNDRDSVLNAGRGASLVCERPNTIVSDLRSAPAWLTLLRRIGPGPVLHLLSSPALAVFAPLANACFMQVTGRPVLELESKSQEALNNPEAKTARKKRTRADGTRRGRRRSSKNETQVAEGDLAPTQPATPVVLQATPISHAIPLQQSRGVPLARASTGISPTSFASTTLICSEGKVVKKRRSETMWTSNQVIFGKHRLFHARADYGASQKQKLTYGLGTQHILTRLPVLFDVPETVVGCSESTHKQAAARHLAKYIFPRQFGLHNPFTEKRANAKFDILPDYEDREDDIKQLGPVKTPERVKRVLPLLSRMILLHGRCNYRKVLDKLAPSKTKTSADVAEMHSTATIDLPSQLQARTQVSRTEVSIDVSHPSLIEPHGAEEAAARAQAKPRFEDYVCSNHEVMRFVRAVVTEVVPRDMWGSQANLEAILDHIAALLRSRRFEFMSVHTILQGFCVSDCDWLRPRSSSNPKNQGQRPSTIETACRLELLQEFLFWFVDGFLVSLLRTCFYITESSVAQNRFLFFRKDDWETLTKPLMRRLGQTTFERIPFSQIKEVLQGRDLGVSFVRLMPKATGVRPIVNLARRPLVTGPKGQLEVGKTINKILQSTFDVLTFERKRNPGLVGSLVLSPHEIYSKFKAYKDSLLTSGGGQLPKLYFVKVDAQACYDTIKQDKMLKIVETILQESEYIVRQYGQVTSVMHRPSRQFKRSVDAANDVQPFPEAAAAMANDLHHAIIVDQVRQVSASRDDVLRLLREHITTNLVRVGKHLLRQKDGIPQGSVLSSLLCSLFYGDMERVHLSFTKDSQSLLMRYVDDFLFITTKKALAVKFLKTMSDGFPDYGCTISIEKRLTNFDIALQPGELVLPLAEGKDFAWCGLAIDTETLAVSADFESNLQGGITDKLTVQHYRRPGHSFVKSMLRAVKIRAHVMYNDTTHNTTMTVYRTTYQILLVLALKFQAYVKVWGADPRKQPVFFTNTLRQLVRFHYSVVQSRVTAKQARCIGAKCDVKRPFILWLGLHAFHRVLSRKPAVWSSVLHQVSQEMKGLVERVPGMTRKLSPVVASRSNDFVDSVGM
ncbi:hypothetical protein ACM66B_000323 [Microbotryomycetes sp. NB124-2]